MTARSSRRAEPCDPALQPVAAAERDALLAPLSRYARLVLAVSGGADSTALLHLVAAWRDSADSGPELVVATVDHGLRRESAAEAAWVRARAEAYGIAHETLTWPGPKPGSGLQDAARTARYDLLADLARAEGNSAIVTAHHADDQAETVVMRLMRGSGIDGLAGIHASTRWGGICVERPLLDLPRGRLAATLGAAGRDWLDDPSNRSSAFERVRVRRAMAHLTALGLTSAKVALSAKRLARAQAALEGAAGALAAAAVEVDEAGFCTLDRERFQSAPDEIALRVLGRVLEAVGGSAATVRLKRLEALHCRIRARADMRATLAGCLIRKDRETLSVYREPGRRGVPELALLPGESAVWDGRFAVAVAASESEPMRVTGLGADGLRRLTERVEGLRRPPAPAAAGLPAFWRGDSLIAVPQIGYVAGRRARAGAREASCRSQFINNARVMMSAAVLANSLHDPIF